MKRTRRFAAVGLLIALLLQYMTLGCFAESAEEDFPQIPEASAAYLYHLESGRAIGGKNETVRLPAASTVKLLSGLIICERLQYQLMDEIVIGEEMLAGSKGYRYGLEAGETYTVEQLIYLALCGSYNDAYNTLAYLIGGGSVSAFVEEMNLRAVQCGAASTTVTDPTGVADSSFTTAEDLLRIAQVACRNPLYMQTCGSATYDLSNGQRIHNRNALISKGFDSRYYNPKCAGMTAGSTNAGGCCVVTLAQRENDSYLCIVLGGAEGEEPNPENYGYVVANRLINWAYERFTYLELITPETEICSIPVRVSDLVDQVAVRPAEAVALHLPKGAELGRDVKLSIRLMYDSLEAPVVEGVHVGYVAVVYQGQILTTVPLYTAEAAERSGFVGRLMSIRTLTEKRSTRAGLIFFAVTCLGWLTVEYLLRRYRRHKWDRYFSQKIDLPDTLMK
ncbi:MAG: D-alanyl-D-alanine carboxypeptidase [Ruminococcaceae bacterium]|nr:D-alanyl-D-alanine carboxypeptidase [Oscillospiraceae bacterium]